MHPDVAAGESPERENITFQASLPRKVPFLALGAAVLALAALLYFVRLGATPLRVNAEIRTFEITQHMLETGEEAIPVFRGETRFNKPPLYYWSVVALSRLTDHFDLTIHRLPTAVCALGVLALVFVWGGLLNRPQEALLAAAMLAVTYLFVVQARRGTFEMMLAFFSHLSLLCFYLSARRRSALLAYLGSIFWGLAFLTKGTPSLLFVPLPLAVWLWGQGKLQAMLRKELIPALLLGGGLAVSWYCYVLFFYPDARHDLLGEFFLPMGIKATPKSTAEHREPFYFYAVEIWRSAFPVALFLPLLVWYAWKKRGFPPATPQRLLLLTCILPFAIFSCIPMKQDHYLLPLLPALALLTAQAISETCALVTSKGSVLLKGPLLILGFIGLAAGIIVGGGSYIVLDVPLFWSIVISLVILGMAAMSLFLLANGRYVRSLIVTCLVVAMSFGWYFFWIRPIEDGFGSTAIFRSPNFDKSYWEQKFSSYPRLPLRHLLDYDYGLKKFEKSQKRSPPTLLKESETVSAARL